MAKHASGKAPAVGEKPFLHINLRAFSHATEDKNRVARALALAAGFNPDDEKDAERFEKVTDETSSEGYFHNPIFILETEISRSAEVKRFWRQTLAVDALRERLVREVDQRLDDDLVFWMRLDKQGAAEGKLRLGFGEDVIQVRAKLATYPRDRGVGLGFLTTFLENERPATS